MRSAITLRPLINAVAILVTALCGTALGSDVATEQWRAFRKVFPNHIQTLAMSQPDVNGAIVVVIAEPPPDRLPKSGYPKILHEIFGTHLKHVHLEHREIGLHGWIDDLVLTIGDYGGPNGPTSVRDDIALLATRIWGTSYKSDPLTLPIDLASLTSTGPPNLAIRQTELDDWLVKGKVSFTPVSSPWGQPKTLKELIGQSQDGAFLSAPQRGLAVLVVNRHRPFDDYRGEFRKFAIDSDIMIGAVGFGSDYLVFVGRERDVPVTVMPPLRFETANTLVTSQKSELAQSYERNDVFAGRIEIGQFTGYDWAPIYLSPELINTEFGSELNLTDQMLKSWSMAGLVQYHNFFWPTPDRLPFGGEPIMAQVRKKEPRVNETLFNWNTTGAFSRIDYDSQAGNPHTEVYALLYSGSLPVIYKDESQPEFDSVFSPFETEGYKYFRDLRNPLLARVTSYQVMFQATRGQPLRSNFAPARVGDQPPSPLLRELVKAKLHQATAALAKIDDAKVEEMCKGENGKGPRDPDRCIIVVKELILSVRVVSSSSDRLRDRIVDGILNPRMSGRPDEPQTRAVFDILQAIDDGKSITIPSDLEPAMAAVVARLFLDSAKVVGLIGGDDRLIALALTTGGDKEDNQSYITTPRAVVSSSGMPAVGGHNLSGITPKVVIDDAVPSGNAKVVSDAAGTTALHINHADADNAGLAARVFAKKLAGGEQPEALQQELRVVLSQTQQPRAMRAALSIERPDTDARGSSVVVEQGNGARAGSGWRPVPADAQRLAHAIEIAKDLDLTVLVTNVNGEFSIICVYCASGQEVIALSHVAMRESLVDAIAHAPLGMEQRIFFEGFTQDQVTAFRQTLAFDGGGMKPPIGPPSGAAAPAPDPGGHWWRNHAKNGDHNSTNNANHNGIGNNDGPSASDPVGPENKLLILVANESRSGVREVEVHVTEGGSTTRAIGDWMLVRREMSRSLDWSAAKVEPIAHAPGPKQSMSIQLTIPSKLDPQSFSGRFQVEFDRVPLSGDRNAVTTAANDEIKDRSALRQTVLAGVGRLIDRLKNIPHVQDVKFFLRIGTGDAILSDLPPSNEPGPG